jgi:hypothetical protein
MDELLAPAVADVAAAVLGNALGDAAVITDWHTETVPYDSGSPATGGLSRVRGKAGDGREWSVFVKLIQHVRHWPRIDVMPPHLREEFVAQFPWDQELSAWDEPFAGHLPPSLRVPVLYRCTDLGDDRMLLWMEDVDALDQTQWTVATFAAAAYALGGLAARRSTPEILATSAWPAGYGLRRYAEGRLEHTAANQLADDALWRHPYVLDAVDPRLRDDMRRLVAAVPGIVDRLDALPQALPHGDASPQNLLALKEAPDRFVAIDVAFQHPYAFGFDLGQLLVGLAHAGCLPVSALPEIHEALVPAFVAGARDGGSDVSPDDVRLGYVGCLAIRSGASSMPFELLGSPAASPELFAQRAALSRFVLDLWLD